MKASRSIAENVAEVRSRIRKAAERVGRDAEDIRLVAVVKNVGIPEVRDAMACGITDLGENRVQDLLEKMPQLPLDAVWHFMGHLQTNKVRQIIRFVELIHSVDSLSLVEEINKRAAQIEKEQGVLIQINVLGEKSKFGLEPEKASSFLKEIRRFSNVKPKGMMTIAPLTEDPETVRPAFAGLRELYEEVVQAELVDADFKYLSMGMSNDFEVAIEEGSNLVRIGTAIFGTS